MSRVKQKHHGIFISYRRSDARADAGRIYDRLSERFSDDDVFMDIDDIEPGQNFQKVLQKTLTNCDVLLVVIGPNWLETKDEDNGLRLHDNTDFVRLEIATALDRHLPIIPVLVNRASMPTLDQLPVEIQSLANHQAIELSDSRFHDDVDTLIQVLGRILSVENTVQPSFRSWIWAVPISVVLLLLAAWYWFAYSDQPVRGEARRVVPNASPTDQSVSTLRTRPIAINADDVLDMVTAQDFFEASLNPQGKGISYSLEIATREGDSVVIDRRKKLMWQRSGTGRQLTFSLALNRVQSMNQRRFAGQTNWRIPTAEEAASLLLAAPQQGIHMAAKLNPKNTPILWTSDSARRNSNWVIYVYDGKLTPESQEFNAWLRAVRSIE